MLRQDKTARLTKEPPGCLSFSGPIYRVHCKEQGKSQSGPPITQAQYDALLNDQQGEPVNVLQNIQTGRRWWMYQDKFYWEDEDLSTIEVKAFIMQRERTQQKKIDRALAMLESDEVQSAAREPIPDDVKMFVWQRDGGKCVSCSSSQKLEYDHIIPFSMGGSNTARNLQLLCETCNRSKGANLV